jgi:pimeloyl-ACP methyl ester carboxylesterase
MLTSESVALPGGRTARVMRGGSGPEIVWLHGPHGLRGHDPVVVELARRYSVIAPLAPGFDDLAQLDDIDSVHDLALYYDAVFNALDLDTVTLIGHSFGAMVAAEYAAHYPRRVEKLVLISPFGLWRDDHPVAEFFGVPYMAFDKLLWKSGKASPEMSDPADEPNDPVEKQVSVAQALTTVAKFIWPIPDRGLRRRLPRITAPTLVIFGADDGVIPPVYADEFAGAIHNARKAVIGGAAHMAPYEQPAEFFRLLWEFLGSGDARQSPARAGAHG